MLLPIPRIKRPTLPKTVLIALGFVVGLLFCAAVIAALSAHAGRDSSQSMKNHYRPFMETALSLERLVSEAVFHASAFDLSGDMASYSGARIQFPAIRATADLLASRAESVPVGHTLSRDLEALHGLTAQLNHVVEKKHTLTGQRAVEQASLQKTAEDMSAILLDLQNRLASVRIAPEKAGGEKNNTWDDALDEKVHLLVLNGFSLAVAKTTNRALASVAAKNVQNLATAEESFIARWEEAGVFCRKAASLPPLEGIRVVEKPAEALERLGASYVDTLVALRSNLEKSFRVSQDGICTTGHLTALARNIVTASGAGLDAAVDRTDTALRRAAASLFACALLACLLAVGAAFVFLRSRLPRDKLL